MTGEAEGALIENIYAIEGQVDYIIVADYDEEEKGVLTDQALRHIKRLLDEAPLIRLSRKRIKRMIKYDYLILDHEELKQAIYYNSTVNLQTNVAKLWTKNMPDNIIVTLQGEGAGWYNKEFDNELIVPSVPLIDNTDTCGCGDAFVAMFAACIAVGQEPGQAIQWGNAAGRAQARKLYGARNISVEEIEREWEELYAEKG